MQGAGRWIARLRPVDGLYGALVDVIPLAEVRKPQHDLGTWRHCFRVVQLPNQNPLLKIPQLQLVQEPLLKGGIETAQRHLDIDSAGEIPTVEIQLVEPGLIALKHLAQGAEKIGSS